MAEKPDDVWVVPLCVSCHRSQHTRSERDWWRDRHIEPAIVALALWAATGDNKRAEEIVGFWRNHLKSPT
jgi:hypothetical protein